MSYEIDVYSDIGIDSAAFAPVRGSFDASMKDAIQKMLRHDNDECVISLKMKVEIETKHDDFGIEYKEPTFKYDITSEVKEKAKIDGCVYSKGQLEYNEESKRYRISPIPERQERMEI